MRIVHLKKMDLVRIAGVAALFSVLSLICFKTPMGALVFSSAITLLLTVQLEIYRRVQWGLRRKSAAEFIPAHLLSDYTLKGTIPAELRYFDDCRIPENAIVYRKKQIDAYMAKVQRQEVSYYGETDTWLYEALKSYPIQGQNVAILGSTMPWYESICLAFGGRPVTIEYNRIISKDPRLKVLTPAEYDQNPVRFDAILSISSFEHDGIGRYGDPLNPSGDIEAMNKMRSMLRPKGLLFLSVPVAKDLLVWNEGRIYGKIRLPMLLAGWKVLAAFGFTEDLQEKDHKPPSRYAPQPIFVLQDSR